MEKDIKKENKPIIDYRVKIRSLEKRVRIYISRV